MEKVTENIIAYIRTDYNEKFAIPRQSGLARTVEGTIVFVPEFRNPDALRGLEGFSHLWIIWEFSENRGREWTPTVRPPRLGGNTRVGVFATRSPFRPNPIGLSCVKIKEIRWESAEGPIILVEGPDMLDGTPILDIKPYLAYSDSVPDAADGFLSSVADRKLKVDVPEDLLDQLDEDFLYKLKDVMSNDPRPTYQSDPERVYGVTFCHRNVLFCVEENTLKVIDIQEMNQGSE